jgi:toxin YoeB
MSYQIEYTTDALKDIDRLKKSGDKLVLKKLISLLAELQEHPRTGTGQVEVLKHYSEETFSRRINREHRLVYRIREETVQVLVISAYGHY